MLQNYYDGKVVVGKGYLLERCIIRRQMPKRYVKYGLFLFSRDYQVVWATMMGNECFIITIYIYMKECGVKSEISLGQ